MSVSFSLVYITTEASMVLIRAAIAWAVSGCNLIIICISLLVSVSRLVGFIIGSGAVLSNTHLK